MHEQTKLANWPQFFHLSIYATSAFASAFEASESLNESLTQSSFPAFDNLLTAARIRASFVSFLFALTHLQMAGNDDPPGS